MTQFLRFWRRYVPGLTYAAIASVIFLLALHIIDDAATVSVFIGGNVAFPCVLALLLSLGITATFRAIDGRYVFHRGDAVYRGAAASFVVWLMCFTTILAGLLISGVVAKMPTPLWQTKSAWMLWRAWNL